MFSYWMAIYVVDLLGLSVNQWCFDVEPYSFGCDIVYHEDSTADNILEKLDGFRDIEITKVKRLINNEDIQLLLSCYEDLKEKYSLSSEKWSQCENWESNESSYERRLVEELLYKNGVKDEDRIKGSKSKTSSEDSSNIKDKNGVQTETEKKI